MRPFAPIATACAMVLALSPTKTRALRMMVAAFVLDADALWAKTGIAAAVAAALAAAEAPRKRRRLRLLIQCSPEGGWRKWRCERRCGTGCRRTSGRGRGRRRRRTRRGRGLRRGCAGTGLREAAGTW